MRPGLVPPDKDSADARYVCVPRTCPLGGKHLRNGNEFALGCGSCRAQVEG